MIVLMSGSRSSSIAERSVPKLKWRLMSAGVSHLHRNIISHPLPEVVGKVHLRLREDSVYDGLWDPALQTTRDAHNVRLTHFGHFNAN